MVAASKLSYLSVWANEYRTNGHSMLLCERTGRFVCITLSWAGFVLLGCLELSSFSLHATLSECANLIIRISGSHYHACLKNSLSLKHDNESTNK